MQTEIEAKFLDVDHDQIRKKLTDLKAELESPMHIMRRKMFDFPDGRFQKDDQRQRLRIRDEGDKVMINYKVKNQTNYVDEIETLVGSFDDMTQILDAIGMKSYSYQESKREVWRYKGSEIVLDEWPWLSPYIEIEGPKESVIQEIAQDLGFSWENAKFGSVDTAYRQQYPKMTRSDSIGDLKEVKFDMSTPDYLIERK